MVDKTRHTPDHYMDGHVRVEFCKVCGAEGLKLLEDCPQKVVDISLERRKMAAKCNFSDDPDTWPVDLLDRLVTLEKNEGQKALYDELKKIFQKPT